MGVWDLGAGVKIQGVVVNLYCKGSFAHSLQLPF